MNLNLSLSRIDFTLKPRCRELRKVLRCRNRVLIYFFFSFAGKMKMKAFRKVFSFLFSWIHNIYEIYLFTPMKVNLKSENLSERLRRCFRLNYFSVSCSHSGVIGCHTRCFHSFAVSNLLAEGSFTRANILWWPHSLPSHTWDC